MDPILKLVEVLQLAKTATDRDITLPSLQLILEVHARPGITQGALAERIDVSEAHNSLLVLAMLEPSKKFPRGYSMVEQVVDEDNRRKKKLYLTSKGQTFIRKVKELLQ